MPIVIGTAGHIDHGKTSLVKALTGMDCDRLQEEKHRGITIELGFAKLISPKGTIGIVDVPGHEKFVHAMVAGASGIDFVLLIIAADEGVMPQTREHLEICSLLGIRQGAIVLTKIDTVDAELLELAKEDIQSFLHDSFLQNAPLFPVSAITGVGIDELKNYLFSIEGSVQTPRRQDLFRLPIDRVFSIKGHGTVVTGTLISGNAQVGNEAMLYPKGLKAKIRHVENHKTETERSAAGSRTAINLQGLGVEEIHRGDVLSMPDRLFPSQRFIAHVRCLSSSPRSLKQRTSVHLHHGSKATQAQLYFLEKDALLPGESSLCEIRFKEDMVGIFGDKLVIRSFSPLQTVAGGVIIHPQQLNLRKNTQSFSKNIYLLTMLEKVLAHKEIEADELTSWKNYFTEKAPHTAEDIQILSSIALHGTQGVSYNALATMCSFGGKSLDKYLASLSTKQLIFCYDKEEQRYISIYDSRQLAASCHAALKTYHKNNPLRKGAGRNELVSSWGKGLPPKLAYFIIEQQIKSGEFALLQDLVHISNHQTSIGEEESRLREKILQAHRTAGMAPPNMKDVLDDLKTTIKQSAPLIKLMQDEKELVKVSDAIWYDAQVLESIREKIIRWFDQHENMDLGDLKELTNLSRKYLVVLLEYFDKEKVTMRVGDKRILRVQHNTK